MSAAHGTNGTADVERATLSGRTRRRNRAVAVTAVLILIAVGSIPLFTWRSGEERRAFTLSNLHRLSTGLMLYAQDWDDALMPPAAPDPVSGYRTWPMLVHPYAESDDIFECPSDPTGPHTVDPTDRYRVSTGYALNRRFWNTFSAGPFPIDNLELPLQTALLVEAGPMHRDPLNPPSRPADESDTAVLYYGDTLDRYAGFCPYPSRYAGRLALVALDGHAVTVKVRHYRPQDGPHDPLYGWIGGSVFNWNGGHPNGQTDTPTRQ